MGHRDTRTRADVENLSPGGRLRWRHTRRRPVRLSRRGCCHRIHTTRAPMTPSPKVATMLIAPTTLTSYIDGKPYHGLGEPRIDVINPATGQALTELADVGRDGVEAAVGAAARAFAEWAATTPKDRAIAMLELVAAIENRADELAELETRDMG